MQLGEACNRDVIIIADDSSVIEAAKLMRDYHVGSIVVTKKDEGITKPIGIITDRDLVIDVIAKDKSPEKVTVSDIMNSKLITGKDTDQLWNSLRTMRTHGIRRMPVIDSEGSLIGIITADDILELFSEELLDLTRLIALEQKKEETLKTSLN